MDGVMCPSSLRGQRGDTPITMTMGATGMDGILLNGGSDGLSLSATADALLLDMHIEEMGLFGLRDDTVPSLRVGLEATRPFPLPHGASLTPSMEMGVRQDGGDAETGLGADIRAGVLWTSPEHGISVELKGHLAHSRGRRLPGSGPGPLLLLGAHPIVQSWPSPLGGPQPRCISRR